jgi:hypothetical protein
VHHHPRIVGSLIVRGLSNRLDISDVEELVRKQFPNIDRHTLWESYNLALIALAIGMKPEPIKSGPRRPEERPPPAGLFR